MGRNVPPLNSSPAAERLHRADLTLLILRIAGFFLLTTFG
jgi:hypothetical protein